VSWDLFGTGSAPRERTDSQSCSLQPIIFLLFLRLLLFLFLFMLLLPLKSQWIKG
jgi:hypothetical protein